MPHSTSVALSSEAVWDALSDSVVPIRMTEETGAATPASRVATSGAPASAAAVRRSHRRAGEGLIP